MSETDGAWEKLRDNSPADGTASFLFGGEYVWLKTVTGERILRDHAVMEDVAEKTRAGLAEINDGRASRFVSVWERRYRKLQERASGAICTLCRNQTALVRTDATASFPGAMAHQTNSMAFVACMAVEMFIEVEAASG